MVRQRKEGGWLINYVTFIKKFMLKLEEGYDAASHTSTQIANDLFPEYVGEDRTEAIRMIALIGKGLIQEE